MKKFIVTILAVFYLGVSSGATVHFHYCMGQLVEWQLVSKEQAKCSKCGMKPDNAKDCCKKQSQQIKVDAPQKLSESTYQFKAFSTDLGFQLYSSETDKYTSSLRDGLPFSNAPPEIQKTPAFILHCNFRI